MIETLTTIAHGVPCCGPSTGSLMGAYAQIVAGLALAVLLAYGAVALLRRWRRG